MEMLNRAIEDASDFEAMKRKLLEGKIQEQEQRIFAAERQRGAQELLEDTQKLEIAPAGPDPLAKLPGENRAQYRARIHGKKAGQP